MPPYTEQQRNYWMSRLRLRPARRPVHLHRRSRRLRAISGAQHGGQTVGSVTSGSVSLPGDIDLSRLWRRSATQFRLNQNGTGSLVDFITANPGATILMSTPHGDVTLVFDDAANSTATVVNFTIIAAQNVILERDRVGGRRGRDGHAVEWNTP